MGETNPFICGPPVTAALAPASFAPLTRPCMAACFARGNPELPHSLAHPVVQTILPTHLIASIVALLKSDPVSFETRWKAISK